MSAPSDGGPAFPLPLTATNDGDVLDTTDYGRGNGGMSLRDWFAGQALAGLLSGPCSKDGVPRAEWFDCPAEAYQLADAMLKAREET